MTAKNKPNNYAQKIYASLQGLKVKQSTKIALVF